MPQQITEIQNFNNNITKMKDQFKIVLPAHINVDKFMMVIVSAIQRNPYLLTLDRTSLYNACTDCAKDGLIPDGREAALIPAKGKVRYSPMIGGITKKARNSGEIATIDAQVVCEKDEYDSWVDEKGAHFKHRKARSDRGRDVLTYAYAITKDGNFYFEEMDEKEMMAVEKCCTAQNYTPWKGPFKREMKRKTALHRLCKYRIPSSTDLMDVIHRDDDMYDLQEKSGIPAIEDRTTVNKKSRLENIIEEQTKDVPVATDLKTNADSIEPGEIVYMDMPAEETKPAVIKSESLPQSLNIQGIVDDLKVKDGTTNNKQWRKYGARIKGEYYTTFSLSLYEMLVSAMDNKEAVKVVFDVVVKNERKMNNIVSVEVVDKEDIPI